MSECLEILIVEDIRNCQKITEFSVSSEGYFGNFWIFNTKLQKYPFRFFSFFSHFLFFLIQFYFLKFHYLISWLFVSLNSIHLYFKLFERPWKLFYINFCIISIVLHQTMVIQLLPFDPICSRIILPRWKKA